MRWRWHVAPGQGSLAVSYFEVSKAEAEWLVIMKEYWVFGLAHVWNLYSEVHIKLGTWSSQFCVAICVALMEEGCFSYVVPSNKPHKIVAESNDTISLAHFSAVWAGFGRFAGQLRVTWGISKAGIGMNWWSFFTHLAIDVDQNLSQGCCGNTWTLHEAYTSS